MKKTMIYLPEEIHEGLRNLAFEQKTSIAELVRRAVEQAYKEDLEDIKTMEHELALYAADCTSAVELDDYLAQRGVSVSS